MPSEPLVLIPGLGSDGAVWQPTIDTLGADVACQIGDTLRDDTLAAMAMRILADAPERFALAGVSMGGMVALEMLRVAPGRVTRLALVDTNARPDTPEQSAQRLAANAAILASDDLAALARASLGYLIHPTTGPAVRDAMAAMTVRVGAETYARQNLAAMNRADLRPLLADIGVPTIVVVGAQDLLTPLSLSQEICAGVAGATLHVIPDCGHLPPIERPAALAALLRAWLAG